MSLRYAILGLLAYTPMSGYNLKKIFDETLNHFWTANLSQIYRELGSLEKTGYLTSSIEPQDDRPDKRIYSITEAGNKAFRNWLEDFPEALSAQKRDEFMVRIFFGSKLDKSEMKKQFERFVEERRTFEKEMAEQKQKFKRLLEKGGINEKMLGQVERDKLFWRFTIKRALITNQALIQWAQECINDLETAIIEGEK